MGGGGGDMYMAICICTPETCVYLAYMKGQSYMAPEARKTDMNIWAVWGGHGRHTGAE